VNSRWSAFHNLETAKEGNMKKRNLAMAAAFGLSLGGCGVVDDLVANLQEKLLGALNVDSGSLQDVVGQATGNFAEAGDAIGDYVNLENDDAAEAAKSFQPSNRGGGGGDTGFAPRAGGLKYLSLAEEGETDLDCIEVTKNDAGTEVKESFEACEGISGSIITTLESTEGEEIVKLKFENYTVGVSDDEDYEFLNGTQKWTVSFLKGGGIKMQASNTYEGATHKRPEKANFTDQISFTFSDGLLVDGTSTIIQGATTAVLRFTEVAFNDDCAFGPASGSLDMTIGTGKIEVKVTDCGAGVETTTEGDSVTDSKELNSDEVNAFFADVLLNMGAMEENIEQSAGGSASCSADVTNANLKKYQGFWCEAFPQGEMKEGSSAWLNCVKICNVDSGKEYPDFYNFGGLGSLINKADGSAPAGLKRDVMGEEMGFISHDFEISCIEPFAFIRGVVEFDQEITVGQKKYDQVLPQFGFDDLALPGEGEFGEGDFPDDGPPPGDFMGMSEGAPEFKQAWAKVGAEGKKFGVWDVFADSTNTSLWAFDAFKKIDGAPEDFPPCSEEDYAALEQAASGFDYCADAPAGDPYCSDADPYCIEFPEDPSCAGAVDCQMYPDDPFCGGGEGSVQCDWESADWCDRNPGDYSCVADPETSGVDCCDGANVDGTTCGVQAQQ
jgi:hypothetical protein